MAKPTKTGAKALKVYNPKYLFITPFEGEAKGATTYQIENVVRDTTTIGQNDNEENPVNSEFESAPIVNNITAGSFTFATEIGDMQADVMKLVGGYEVDSLSNKIYAPEGYKEVFVEIALVFEVGGKNIAAILPKVQLDSKALLESLNTSVGKITVEGTGYNLDVIDGSNHHITPFYIDPNYTIPSGE